MTETITICFALIMLTLSTALLAVGFWLTYKQKMAYFASLRDFIAIASREAESPVRTATETEK